MRLLLLIFIPCLLFAQGGSNYSSIGVGDLNNDNSAVFSGMAGTSIAMPNANNINYTNPALWSKVETTRLQMSYFFNQRLVSGNDLSLAQNYGKVDGISIVFAIDTANGIALGMGLNSFSTVNYQASSAFSGFVDELSVSGKMINTGFGGLSNAFFGVSAEFFDRLSIAIRPGLIFGTITERNEIIVDQIFGNDSETLSNDSFRAFNLKTAAYLELPYNINIGAFYMLASDLSVKSNTVYRAFVNNPRVDFNYGLLDTLDHKLPSSFGVGLSWKNKRNLIGLDYITQDFSTFTYNPNTNSEFTTMTTVSIGYERTGNKRSGADPLDKWDYRAGFGYKQLPYIVANEQITDIFASFGTSIPFGTSSYFDFGVIAGSRGISSDVLVNETYGKFYFNISIGETWFKPFERDFDDIED